MNARIVRIRHKPEFKKGSVSAGDDSTPFFVGFPGLGDHAGRNISHVSFKNREVFHANDFH